MDYIKGLIIIVFIVLGSGFVLNASYRRQIRRLKEHDVRVQRRD